MAAGLRNLTGHTRVSANEKLPSDSKRLRLFSDAGAHNKAQRLTTNCECEAG